MCEDETGVEGPIFTWIRTTCLRTTVQPWTVTW